MTRVNSHNHLQYGKTAFYKEARSIMFLNYGRTRQRALSKRVVHGQRNKASSMRAGHTPGTGSGSSLDEVSVSLIQPQTGL